MNIDKAGMDEIRAQAVDYIRDNTPDCHGADLHNEIYNQDYFIIGSYKAEQWLSKHVGIFQAIGAVREYERDNFGEVYTDLTEPEKILNMLVYIAGAEILAESKTLSMAWNRMLTEEDCADIVAELSK
jgi:hypothetical protein